MVVRVTISNNFLALKAICFCSLVLIWSISTGAFHFENNSEEKKNYDYGSEKNMALIALWSFFYLVRFKQNRKKPKILFVIESL